MNIKNNFNKLDLKNIIKLINININRSVEYLSIKRKLVVENKKINKKILLSNELKILKKFKIK